MTDPAQSPPDADLRAIEELAVDLAQRAGAELDLRFTQPVEVRFKRSLGRDPVTDADEAVEALVRDAVRTVFPAHAFLGEEGGARAGASGYTWVVDPLDGTANFANGVPVYACSIGVLHRGMPVVAALYTTFGPDGRACLLHARRGCGLHRDGRPFTPLPAAERGRLVGVPAGFGRRVRSRLWRRMPPGESRSFGSIAVELGLTACGRLRYSFFGSPKIWDVAAGVLLVEEAGGAVLSTTSGRWRPLKRFDVPQGFGLERWRGSLTAGEPAVVREHLRASRLRISPPERLERVLGPGPALRVEDRLRSAASRIRAARPLLRRASRTVRRLRQPVGKWGEPPIAETRIRPAARAPAADSQRSDSAAR